MRSCKDVSTLMSESLDRKLSLRERFGLKTHLLVCKGCQRMARQMQLLSAASRRVGFIQEDGSSPAQEALSAEARARIQAQVKRSGSGSPGHE